MFIYCDAFDSYFLFGSVTEERFGECVDAVDVDRWMDIYEREREMRMGTHDSIIPT